MIKFRPYESKPITRMAVRIEGEVDQLSDSDYWYCGINFKAYQAPLVGDYIVRLTEEDTYHVSETVFKERNIVNE